MPKLIDLTGQTFGAWEVLERVPRPPGGKGSSKWLCKCTLCGDTKEVMSASLRQGKSTCCTVCSNKKKIKNMTGQVIRDIRVIEQASRDEYKGASIHWRCVCPVCKREDWIVDGSDLRNEHGVTMCQRCASLKALTSIKTPYHKDLTGKRFGKLVAICPTQERLDTSVVWECRCDCGRLCRKASSYLINGDTSSCGSCNLTSKGEAKIITLLEENDIPFQKEYVVTIDSHRYRFDFYIPSFNCFIEYDGRQHFSEVNSGWNESLKNIQERDMIKNHWIEETNNNLIRIPYQAYEDFDLNDLNPATSRYLFLKER